MGIKYMTLLIWSHNFLWTECRSCSIGDLVWELRYGSCQFPKKKLKIVEILEKTFLKGTAYFLHVFKILNVLSWLFWLNYANIIWLKDLWNPCYKSSWYHFLYWHCISRGCTHFYLWWPYKPKTNHARLGSLLSAN